MTAPDERLRSLQLEFERTPGDVEVRERLYRELLRTGRVDEDVFRCAAGCEDPAARVLFPEAPHREVTNELLEALTALPLQRLNLRGSKELTNAGVKHLRGLPLEDLDLENCNRITDLGFGYLRDLPLRRLILDGCRVTDKGLAKLRSLALEILGLSVCGRFTNAGLQHLQDHPLRALDLNKGARFGDVTQPYGLGPASVVADPVLVGANTAPDP